MHKADEYLEYANDAGMVPVFGLAFSAGMDVLTTIHPWWYRGDKRQAWNETWYDFIMLQGAHVKTPPPHTLYYDAYKFGKPVLEGECRYEGIHGFTAADVREVAYRAIQAGSFGYTYGSHGLWYPTERADDETFKNWGKSVVWNKALQRPGGAQMRHLRACYESAAWWKLKPTPDAVKTGVELQESQKILTRSDGDRTYLIYVREALVAVDSQLRLPRKIDEQDWMLILRKQ